MPKIQDTLLNIIGSYTDFQQYRQDDSDSMLTYILNRGHLKESGTATCSMLHPAASVLIGYSRNRQNEFLTQYNRRTWGDPQWIFCQLNLIRNALRPSFRVGLLSEEIDEHYLLVIRCFNRVVLELTTRMNVGGTQINCRPLNIVPIEIMDIVLPLPRNFEDVRFDLASLPIRRESLLNEIDTSIFRKGITSYTVVPDLADERHHAHVTFHNNNS